MRWRKPHLFLALGLLLSVPFLFWAQRQGEAKFVFDVTLFDEPVPVPIVHQLYAGEATPLAPERIRVRWAPVQVAGRDTLEAFRCAGSFRCGRSTYYLLEAGDRLYVERADFIEPLLITIDFYARHGVLPAELEYLLDDPDLDRDLLGEFMARLAGTTPDTPASTD
jgi:hypothetical protein